MQREPVLPVFAFTLISVTTLLHCLLCNEISYSVRRGRKEFSKSKERERERISRVTFRTLAARDFEARTMCPPARKRILGIRSNDRAPRHSTETDVQSPLQHVEKSAFRIPRKVPSHQPLNKATADTKKRRYYKKKGKHRHTESMAEKEKRR